MTAKIIQNQSPIDEASASQTQHLLMVLPQKKADAPLNQLLEARLKRRDAKYDELAKAPVAADLAGGGRVVWVVADEKKSAFERNTALRKAVALLLEEGPSQLTIAVFGDETQRKSAAEAAIYVALVNAAELPTRKKKSDHKPLKKIVLHGWQQDDDFVRIKAVAEGNTLTRTLSVLPPNELTPGIYRDKIKELAEQHGWQHEEFDMKKLRKLGAGAFVAVAQGSDPEDAAIVHLTYTPEKAKKHIALVGKGICFDTGGHNLKPARYMQGMHEDMNGSAVVLGTLLAATKSKLSIKIDCWLALAQNHISAKAYKQNDVVKALNGMTIEVVHTDAEGRMVLSDTLTLASRGKPQAMIDYATLTGSMVTALGTRYSGVLGNRQELLQKAIAAGQATGERVCAFPFDEDYDPELDSKIADIKQCTLDGEADHILAARFLSKFIENDVPWLHVDLSAVVSKGGLGAVASDTTGFGVALSLALLQEI
ncbi:leucyl aminopeptidase [Novimethylophilus kurashikiensis]|uniref:Leucyl aminopeptidase n=1 Tax=Novimethylophilus kurashikiensis TaxID=1825523 RepID=A0A2R5FB15_9PROT|nr:leucyl aminopeptidase family protein [Novimethylophilus kurashikiensis]GBG14093.1 leucyl aminopeptidase [Novimethylophilus kurashikiensis]